MKNGQSALFGAFGGAALALAIVWVRQGAEGPAPALEPSSSPASDAAREAPSPPSLVAGVDLTPITNRLDQLTERLRALEAKLDVVAASTQRSAVAEHSSVMLDADTLQHAMEEVERKKLDALSDEALQNSARVAMKGGDSEDGLRRLDALLQRSLTPEKRAEVMTELGMLYRNQGTKEALASSARTLQSVIDAQGMESQLGVAAASQLVWTCSAQKDPGRALAFAEAAARSVAATPDQRINARWAAAVMTQQLGDPVRARTDYQNLLREIDGQPNYGKLALDIRLRLEKL